MKPYLCVSWSLAFICGWPVPHFAHRQQRYGVPDADPPHQHGSNHADEGRLVEEVVAGQEGLAKRGVAHVDALCDRVAEGGRGVRREGGEKKGVHGDNEWY